MKLLVIASIVALAAAIPHHLRKDNPDERGNYYQGDIRLPLPKMNKNGLIDERYRWPNGEVAYQIDGSFSATHVSNIHAAFDDFTSRTGGCITFVERTTESSYVSFRNNNLEGCYSYVGRIGGAQVINYPDWCVESAGSTRHEMLHALGFFHQQSASNRDDYVTIQWENIEPGAENNFDKYDSSYITDFGYAYDYLSVMHYGAYAFSANGLKTIVTTDPDAVIGQRVGFSETDVGKLMAMYNC